jgi:hypothetical protein
MNSRSNSSLYPLVGLSVVLSLCTMITVAAHWSYRGTTVVAAPTAMHRAAPPVQNLNVVMHDPGCHWFQTANGLKLSTSIKGPVNLRNMDEAALKIVGPAGTVIEHVGSSVRLSAGHYKITMVGQASDDNHLKLNVRT